MPAGVTSGFNNNGDGSATFVLLAPNKSDVLLIGDFNNWVVNENYQLYKDGEYFWITLNNLNQNTEYAYQFLVDYNIKIADPYSEKILDPWTDQYIKSGNYPNLKAYPEGLTTGYVSTFKINEELYNWNILIIISKVVQGLGWGWAGISTGHLLFFGGGTRGILGKVTRTSSL
mgnify:CR=1 FL=1